MIIHFNAIQHENRFYLCDFEILKVTTPRFIDFILADFADAISHLVRVSYNRNATRKSSLDKLTA
ncbi:hypothetical protein [Flavobacterium sp. CYK-55]|uniref:hypothetical protein n=1 Tax=Flavobacterium sp. CYK-55 TaxID=2835529 RepID=UPI0020BDB7FD|nr:hypothetical protein [Flavobacterium sp. CYK-55]